MRLRPRNAKVTNESPLIPQTNDKIKDMRSIYLDAPMLRNNEKMKSQKVESKVNADELIKVLQNGKERRNLRRKKN